LVFTFAQQGRALSNVAYTLVFAIDNFSVLKAKESTKTQRRVESDWFQERVGQSCLFIETPACCFLTGLLSLLCYRLTMLLRSSPRPGLLPFGTAILVAIMLFPLAVVLAVVAGSVSLLLDAVEDWLDGAHPTSRKSHDQFAVKPVAAERELRAA
jgi:hypothetical protein